MKTRTRWIEIIIIVMALGLVSLCFAAWDNTKPADSDPVTNWPTTIRANWDALEVSLGVDLNEIHPYYQALAPVTKPDGLTAFDADDLGHIWIDSDNNRTYVLTAIAPTWTPIILELGNNTYFTAVDAAGTGTVDLIMANAADVAVLPDGSELATSGAPTADADISNKLYVDNNTTMVPAVTGAGTGYAAEESVTFPNGMIMKMGYKVRAGANTTITFGTAFPNNIVSAVITDYNAAAAADIDFPAQLSAVAVATLTVYQSLAAVDGFYWIAIGN